MLRCVKKQIPGIELHYLTKEQFRPLLEHNPYVDRIHTIKKDVAEIIPLLKKEGFTNIVDLHRNLRTAQVKLKLRIPSRSFDKINVKKWLAVNFKMKVLPQSHIVDRYIETVRSLGVKNDGMGLDHFISHEDEVNCNSLPERFRKGYIAFAIGAQSFTKRLPEEKIIGICKQQPRPVILLGGKEDEQRGKYIAERSNGMVLNTCGSYSINQSASLVRQAEFVITHDTGLMHIAAAYKKKIFSVWGNTVPEFGMYPYMPGEGSKMIEVQGLSCRPCSKLGFDKCPKGHFRCMNDIPISEMK